MKNQDVREWLTGKHIVQKLDTYLEENDEAFLNVRDQYLKAVEQLRKELDKAASPSVDDMVDAIERQMSSNLFFSGILGIKANLDHFKDPMARTVLDVDFDVFLREDTARRLPKYEQAQSTIDLFFALLNPQQKELFGDVIEYISFLETTGPKLAHYYGYILGNDILYDIVPGYRADAALTMQYRSILARYLEYYDLPM